MKKQLYKTVLVFTAAFITLMAATASEPVPVTLQLKWKHQFQFTGYYAAIEKGFYREAGLSVTLNEAVEGENPSDAVFDGKAGFGVSMSDVILMRSQGRKAVVLAAIFQHSPQILLASQQSGIKHIHDLAGKRIALEPNAADIIFYMNNEGVGLEKCIVDKHPFNTDKLIAGEVDAISAYITDEPFVLNEAGFNYTIMSPSMGGIDFYGDVLFTTENMIKENPDVVKKFREASLKGWNYAMNNPEEIIQLIYSNYSQRHSIEHLRFEAGHMKNLVMANVVEIGYTNPGRWESIAETYKKLHMIDESYTIKGLLYDDYIKHKLNIPWNLLLMLVAVFVVIALATYLFYINARKLTNEIKARHSIEKYLADYEKKYGSLIETMTDGVYRSTHDGKFVEVNPAMVNILGYDTKEELLAVDIKTQLYFAEEERESADLVEKQEEMAVFRLRKKDGTEIWVEDHGRHILDKNGNILFHEGTMRDVTERETARKALQASEERYRTLIENMGEGVGITNENEIFVYANPSAEKIFGVNPGELTGLSLLEFLNIDSIEFVKTETEKRIRGKSSIFELKINTKNGVTKDLLVTATPSIMSDKFVGTFAIFRDITGRKKAEQEIKTKNEELQKLNATKDKFFSIIAHDLKSPFNAIIGFSELLLEQISEKNYSGIEKYAQIIHDSSTRTLDLLMNLLEWSRSQTGRLEFNPEHFDLVGFINDILPMFDNIAGQKSISIQRNFPSKAPVDADRSMINTVIRNLISNAIKFTKPGGEIVVSIAQKPGEIIVSVKDSGIGIPADRIDRLFRIDENYSTPGTNNEQGTGLGLILCKEFIEKHNGKIRAESAEGTGSTFSFALPSTN